MVRKISALLVALIVLFGAVAPIGQCATYSTYANGNISTTYTQYFKDILSGKSILDDYVAFRSSQYEYVMAVGDIDYNGNFKGNGEVKIYTFDTESSNYNSILTYSVSTDSNFTLNQGNTVIYSNLGEYPQLIERGANFEVIQTILFSIMLISVVISRIFYCRKRG